MGRTLLFAGCGYLSGSLLFARYFGWLFGKDVLPEEGSDQNPGTFNAFQYGGFLCGVLTLCGDLLKGFLPVFLYLYGFPPSGGLALVMAMPVLGHILPIFHRFRGGKGIAVTFGCLLGLLPEVRPLLLLAGTFLFFSLIVKISPNYHRTIVTYLVCAVGMIPLVPFPPITIGFALIAAMVLGKLISCPEKKIPCKVDAIWK